MNFGSEAMSYHIFLGQSGPRWDANRPHRRTRPRTRVWPRVAVMEPTAGFMNSTFNDDANFVHSRFNVSDFIATKFNEETKFNNTQFAGISSNT